MSYYKGERLICRFEDKPRLGVFLAMFEEWNGEYIRARLEESIDGLKVVTLDPKTEVLKLDDALFGTLTEE